MTCGCLTCCLQCLSAPRFIDLDSNMGYTALHIAASHGHLETTKVLLKCGASLTYECQGSLRTPLSQSLRTPLMSRAHVTPLHIAAARRHVPMCRAMLQAHVISASVGCMRVVAASGCVLRWQAVSDGRTRKRGRQSSLLAMQALHAASLESAVGGGQPTIDIRNTRDHFQQRPVDIAEALNCPPLAAMLNPNLALHLATAGHGFQVSALAVAVTGESFIPGTARHCCQASVWGSPNGRVLISLGTCMPCVHAATSKHGCLVLPRDLWGHSHCLIWQPKRFGRLCRFSCRA